MVLRDYQRRILGFLDGFHHYVLSLSPYLLHLSHFEVRKFPKIFVFRNRRRFMGFLDVGLHKVLPDGRSGL